MKNIVLVLISLLLIGCSNESQESVAISDKMLQPIPYSQVFKQVGKKPMLLEFGSTTCASCVQMGKILYKIKEDYPQAEVYFIDIYADKEALQNFKIQMIPTQVYVSSEGFEKERHIGAIEYEDLILKLKAEKIL